MTTHRDQLDEAIDRVAARMTQVDDNDALASQIVNALPERSIGFGWLFRSWAPGLAMIAVVIAAGIVWSNRGTPESSPIASPIAGAPNTEVTPLVASVREAEPNRTLPLEPVEPLEPLELSLEPSKTDFEHSLPSIAAVASLELEVIAPATLPEDAPLTLAPLAIADLPMAENISPR